MIIRLVANLWTIAEIVRPVGRLLRLGTTALVIGDAGVDVFASGIVRCLMSKSAATIPLRSPAKLHLRCNHIDPFHPSCRCQ